MMRGSALWRSGSRPAYNCMLCIALFFQARKNACVFQSPAGRK